MEGRCIFSANQDTKHWNFSFSLCDLRPGIDYKFSLKTKLDSDFSEDGNLTFKTRKKKLFSFKNTF